MQREPPANHIETEAIECMPAERIQIQFILPIRTASPIAVHVDDQLNSLGFLNLPSTIHIRLRLLTFMTDFDRAKEIR